MLRHPPISARPHALFPYASHFRSQIIDPTAESVSGCRRAVFRRRNAMTVGIGNIIAKHSWADTANVKAPHLRFTKEEPVRQANLIDLVACAIVALLFQ